mmetsp:Transcript_1112/g.2419  ORF Transcript_1112/g.2419 Transcript_1112/m.2419 type:complete len:168 (+) Transcript_1112:3-506(+)
MLKKLHSLYVMKDKEVMGWSYGDKEFYWIACELAGVHCGFTPRGRPMQISMLQNATLDPRGTRFGCVVQMALDNPHELLYANLDDTCNWAIRLNALTVWSPNTEAVGKPIESADVRWLTSSELAVMEKHRNATLREDPEVRMKALQYTGRGFGRPGGFSVRPRSAEA